MRKAGWRYRSWSRCGDDNREDPFRRGERNHGSPEGRSQTSAPRARNTGRSVSEFFVEVRKVIADSRMNHAEESPKAEDQVQRRRGWLRNGNQPGDPHIAPRCGAKTRSGKACQGPAMPNGRNSI